MFETIMAFLERSVEWQEYQQKGLLSVNILSAIGILVLTVFEAYGVSMQAWTIWKRRSGEAVSVTLFNYNGSAFIACGIYGAYINGAVAAVNGVITGLIHLTVIVLLCIYKPLKWWEVAVVALCPLMPVVMLMIDDATWQATLFIVITLGIGIAMSTQPIEMWAKKETGAVDIRMYLVYVPTTIVWLVYTITLGDIPFIIGTSIGAVVIAATVLVWCYYRRREPNPPPLLVALKFL